MNILHSLILISWICFWSYWFISAFGAKKNSSAPFVRFGGLRVLLVVVGLILIQSSFTATGVGARDVVPSSLIVIVIGFAMTILGQLFAIWARVHLGKNWGTPMAIKVSPNLVTSGPYRYVRHPIYSGVLLAMLGTALTTNVYWLIIFAAYGSYFIYSATVEEKRMTKLFPNDYPKYRKGTHMLIPFVL